MHNNIIIQLLITGMSGGLQLENGIILLNTITAVSIRLDHWLALARLQLRWEKLRTYKGKKKYLTNALSLFQLTLDSRMQLFVFLPTFSLRIEARHAHLLASYGPGRNEAPWAFVLQNNPFPTRADLQLQAPNLPYQAEPKALQQKAE